MTVEQHQRPGNVELLRPLQGAFIGLVSGVAMLAVIMAGSALTGLGLWAFPNAAGGLFLPRAVAEAGFAGLASWIGLAVHFIMAGLLGALYASAQERIDNRSHKADVIVAEKNNYASAQERIDNRSLFIIALYYGFVLWFAATFLILSWLKPDISQAMRNGPVVAGHLAYGAALGLYAISQNGPLSGPTSPD